MHTILMYEAEESAAILGETACIQNLDKKHKQIRDKRGEWSRSIFREKQIEEVRKCRRREKYSPEKTKKTKREKEKDAIKRTTSEKDRRA